MKEETPLLLSLCFASNDGFFFHPNLSFFQATLSLSVSFLTRHFATDIN